jgi:5-methylcytosine-specific restriction protein A
MKTEFEYFLDNWLLERQSAIETQRDYKKFNEDLKAGRFPSKKHPEDLKKYPLYQLGTAQLISKKIPELLHSDFGLPKTKYKIKGSIGQGVPAEIPWICIFDSEITKSAQTGYYIVYLFNAEMNGIYLSLNQGWTQYEAEYGIKRGKEQIRKNANFAQSLLRSDQGFSYAKIDLNATSSLGKGYEAGNICSKFYSTANIPTDQELIDDLRNLIGVFRELKGFVGPDILNISAKTDENTFQQEIQIGERKDLSRGKVSKKEKKAVGVSPATWPRDVNMSYTALDDANYKCENDTLHATFVSGRTGKQFVEAHHLVPMEYQDDFEVSIDVPENIISLCPNCHRAFHLSEDQEKTFLIKKFHKLRAQKLKAREIFVNKDDLLRYYLKNQGIVEG